MQTWLTVETNKLHEPQENAREQDTIEYKCVAGGFFVA